VNIPDPASTPIGELPKLIGQLAELTASAQARLYAHPSDVPADRLLTAEEAAGLLGLTTGGVRRGEWPFRVQVGPSTVRYSAAGIAKYIATKQS
jgi:predicted DNA-binding transcriptional regulator AlpA